MRSLDPLPHEDRVAYVRRLFARTARRYDLMNRLMSLGRDRAWRRTVAGLADLPPGGLVLDVATGTGDVALALLQRYPDGRVVGVDFSPEMMAIGREKAATAGLDGRLPFVNGDALRLPFPDDCFDAVTSGFAMRTVASIPAAFAEMQRVTRPGGRVICLELTRPTTPGWRHFHYLYFFYLVPRLGRLLGSWGKAYTWLPYSLWRFLSPDQLQAVMERAGLRDVGYRRLMLGTVAVHVGVKGRGTTTNGE